MQEWAKGARFTRYKLIYKFTSTNLRIIAKQGPQRCTNCFRTNGWLRAGRLLTLRTVVHSKNDRFFLGEWGASFKCQEKDEGKVEPARERRFAQLQPV